MPIGGFIRSATVLALAAPSTVIGLRGCSVMAREVGPRAKPPQAWNLRRRNGSPALLNCPQPNAKNVQIRTASAAAGQAPERKRAGTLLATGAAQQGESHEDAAVLCRFSVSRRLG